MSESKRILVLTRERYSEKATWSDRFEISPKVKDVEKALRSAVKEYLMTDEGAKLAKTETCSDFNWGDAMMYVPEEVWKKHGLTPIEETEKLVEINVDQDEVLIDDDVEEVMKKFESECD